MFWNKWINRTKEMERCEDVRELLSRYLDNDVASGEAIAIASHLYDCSLCRSLFEAMRAQQTMVSHMPLPFGAKSARERVLARLEHSARTQYQPSTVPQKRAGYAFAVGSAALAVIAGVAFFCLSQPGSAPNSYVDTVPVRSIEAEGLSLPAKDEMSRLFALHEIRSAAALKATAIAASAAPVAVKATPASRPTPMASSVIASKATPNVDAAADEVPEAL